MCKLRNIVGMQQILADDQKVTSDFCMHEKDSRVKPFNLMLQFPRYIRVTKTSNNRYSNGSVVRQTLY